MAEMKVGVIGLDTSHVTAFADLLNDAKNEFHVPGIRIVKAVPGGSQKFALSRDRIAGFTEEYSKRGIEIVNNIEQLAGLDAFFLESVDGDQHLEQFKILAEFGKPVFIDKPLACNYADAKAIVKLAESKHIPIFSSSSIPYCYGIFDMLKPEDTKVYACQAFGPMELLSDYRDYFWYGIHSVAVMYRFLGAGCQSVRVIGTANADLLLGEWADGKFGSILGNRNQVYNFGATVTTDKAQRHGINLDTVPAYAMLLRQIEPFFKTGKSPLTNAEMLEPIAFLEAASRSRLAGGATIKLADLD